MGWDYERYCAAAQAQIGRFTDLVAAADPAAPVPSCPGWTVARLAAHHGAMHRWVEHIVRTRTVDQAALRDLPREPPPADDDRADWLRSGAATLLATLRAVDGDSPAWTWSAADQTAGFWARRVLHEAAIHAADAELALGLPPTVAAEVAVDCVDEFLATLPHVGWLTERLRALPAAGTLHLHATDVDGEWIVRLGPDGPSWERGHEKATTAVRGAAGDLALLVYGRLRPPDDRLALFGDADLLDSWLAATAF